MLSPISKINSVKEKIMKNFCKESVKKFTILEDFKILSNEDLKIFKLYTHINTDLIANVEEMQLIEAYLQGIGGIKNKEVNKKYLENNNNEFISPFATINSSSPMTLRENFNYSALVKEKYKQSEQKKGVGIKSDLGSNTSSLASHLSLDYYKQYQSTMKRYSSKNTYEEIHYIIFLNVLFLIIILILIVTNYTLNYIGIINILSLIQSEYFNLFNIYPDLTDINKNIISLLNVKNNLTNPLLYSSNYTDNVFKDILDFYNEFDTSRNFILNSTFGFSQSFVPNLLQNMTFIQPKYISLQISLNQVLDTLSTYIGYLTNKTLVYPENNSIIILLQNLNIDLYNRIINLFNGSINDTKIIINQLIKNKELFYFIIIILIAGLGGFIYSHILCYYCKQNQMISLLLSIEEESSREIIENIRILKSTIYKKDSDSPEEEKFEEDPIINLEGSSKRSGSKNDKKDQEKHEKLDKKDTKVVKKKLKKYWSTNLNNNISPKVYISLFSKILFIICITLIPFIIGTSISFYDQKSTQIIDLIVNSNNNLYYYVIIFLNYQELIKSNDNLTQKLSNLTNNINTFRNQQFLTSNLLYKTLNGLPNTSEFNLYYDSGFCESIDTQVNKSNNCILSNGSYYKFGFQYVMNININIIDQSITNNDFSVPKNSTIMMNYYTDLNYILAENTFDIMMRSGFKVYSKMLQDTITSFMNAYNNQFLVIFIFCIICLIFNQLISVLFMRHIIRAVNFELKNIFSLMPYLIFLTNPNINNLLSK